MLKLERDPFSESRIEIALFHIDQTTQRGHAAAALLHLVADKCSVENRWLCRRLLGLLRSLLGEVQWRALDAAAAEIAELPLAVVDAHGATNRELADIARAANERAAVALVIVDGFGEASRQFLLELEALAENLELPVLAVAEQPARGFGSAVEAHRLDCLPCTFLRPGSLVLELEEAADHTAFNPTTDARPFRLLVHRCGDLAVKQANLSVLWASRWVESASADEKPAAE